MGIKNLMKVLNDHTPDSIQNIKTSDLNGKKIAIDTSITLYQYITAIRSSGDDLKGPDGKSTSHIQGILSKTLYYLKLGIIPIHVFDGKPPKLKMKILNDRSKIKKEAISRLIEIEEKALIAPLDAELEDEKIKLLKQSVSISRNEMIQAYEIVALLGVPCIFAPEEADSQCAYLSKNNLVDFVASEDMDLLTFGSKKIIRNFLKKGMFIVELDKILSDGDITMEQFIDICILLGCDYTDTIEGIGVKKAWDLIVQYGSIEELIAKDKKIAEAKYKLPDNFRYEEAREYFTNLRHIELSPDKLELSVPKFAELKDVLVNTYGFNEIMVESSIAFLRKKYNIYDSEYIKKMTKQKSFSSDDIFLDDDDNISNQIVSKAKTVKTTKPTNPTKPKINNYIGSDIVGMVPKSVSLPFKKTKVIPIENTQAKTNTKSNDI